MVIRVVAFLLGSVSMASSSSFLPLEVGPLRSSGKALNQRLRSLSDVDAPRDHLNKNEKATNHNNEALLPFEATRLFDSRRAMTIETLEIVDESFFACKDRNPSNETLRDFVLPYSYKMSMEEGTSQTTMDQTISDIEEIIALKIAAESCTSDALKYALFSPKPRDALNITDNCSFAGELCHSVIGGITLRIRNETQITDVKACETLRSINTILQNDEVILSIPNLTRIAVPDTSCPNEIVFGASGSSSSDINEPLVLLFLAFAMGAVIGTLILVDRIRNNLEEAELWLKLIRQHLQELCAYTKVLLGQFSKARQKVSRNLAARIQKAKSKDSVHSSSDDTGCDEDDDDDTSSPSSEDGDEQFCNVHSPTTSLGVVWDDFVPGAFPTGRTVNSSILNNAGQAASSALGLEAIPETEEYELGHGRENILYGSDVNLSDEMTEL